MPFSFSRLRAIAASTVFISLLALPLVSQALSGGGNSVSDLENRTLVSAPTMRSAIEDWTTFLTRTDAWLSDHMGLRMTLIGLHVRLRKYLRIEASENAVRGADGWIFNALDNALIMHQGLMSFSSSETSDWINTALALQKRVEARGARFVVLVAPNKHTIYSEHLPNHPRRVRAPTRLETLEALSGQRGMRFVSPRRTLLAERQLRKLYYQTDTHWTSYGAFLGYREVMDALRRDGLDVSILDSSQLIENAPRPFAGDIYGLLGVERGETETIKPWTVRQPTAVAEETGLSDFDWLIFPAKSWRMDRSEGLTALVLGDSYFEVMAPYLRESFQELTYVHHRIGSGNLPLEALNVDDYDVVILMLVERLLSYPLKMDDASGED